MSCTKPCALEVSASGGLIVRDQVTHSLLADMPKVGVNWRPVLTSILRIRSTPTTPHMPKASISRVDVMNSITLRVTTASASSSGSGSRVAVRFEEPAQLQTVAKLLHEHGVICKDAAASAPVSTMPDLSDPVVQEFVLQLLFREDFESFCTDVAELFDDMREEF